MANPVHVRILKQGADAWNQWRFENPEIVPHLSGAELRDAELRGANLRNANLSGANLRNAELSGADLGGADLRKANLLLARLIDADLRGADLTWACLGGANLRGTKVDGDVTADLARLVARGAVLSSKPSSSEVEGAEEDSLRMTISIPEKESAKDAVEKIMGLYRAINRYHIACGGNGVSIADWRILTEKGALVPGGAG